jgi:hypothetical protein
MLFGINPMIAKGKPKFIVLQGQGGQIAGGGKQGSHEAQSVLANMLPMPNNMSSIMTKSAIGNQIDLKKTSIIQYYIFNI